MNLDFVCSECGKAFTIPIDDYRGQFDHPPNEPVCEDCAEAIADSAGGVMP